MAPLVNGGLCAVISLLLIGKQAARQFPRYYGSLLTCVLSTAVVAQCQVVVLDQDTLEAAPAVAEDILPATYATLGGGVISNDATGPMATSTMTAAPAGNTPFASLTPAQLQALLAAFTLAQAPAESSTLGGSTATPSKVPSTTTAGALGTAPRPPLSSRNATKNGTLLPADYVTGDGVLSTGGIAYPAGGRPPVKCVTRINAHAAILVMVAAASLMGTDHLFATLSRSMGSATKDRR